MNDYPKRLKLKKRTLWNLLLCYFGIHNKNLNSGTGVVHYCDRCGTITKDSRKKETSHVK